MLHASRTIAMIDNDSDSCCLSSFATSSMTANENLMDRSPTSDAQPLAGIGPWGEATPSATPSWIEGKGDGQEAMLMQVGWLGQGYKAWVHRPVGGRPRFFSNPMLEGVTMTHWWLVPLLWTPALMWCLAHTLASKGTAAGLALVGTGLLIWQLLEYSIHRFLFHSIPDTYWGITAHFLFHGCHHKYPLDASRLVFPPLPAAAVSAAIIGVLHLCVPRDAVVPLFTGIGMGYLAYDCMHYCFHHGNGLAGRGILGALRQAHLQHHYKTPDAGFGISSPLFDFLLSSHPERMLPNPHIVK